MVPAGRAPPYSGTLLLQKEVFEPKTLAGNAPWSRPTLDQAQEPFRSLLADPGTRASTQHYGEKAKPQELFPVPAKCPWHHTGIDGLG